MLHSVFILLALYYGAWGFRWKFPRILFSFTRPRLRDTPSNQAARFPILPVHSACEKQNMRTFNLYESEFNRQNRLPGWFRFRQLDHESRGWDKSPGAWRLLFTR